MKKIIFFNNSYPTKEKPNLGTYAKTLVEVLEKTGYAIEPCVLENKYNKAVDYLRYYLKLTFLKLPKKNSVLYINHFTFLLPLIFRLLFIRRRCIFHWHGEELVNDSLLFILIRKLMKNCFKNDSIHISPSNYYTKLIETKLCIPTDQIIISPSGGVDTDVFKPLKINLLTDVVNIGFPAALSKHKGIDYLYKLIDNIDYLENLLKRKVVIHVIDYGDESLHFKNYIKKNNFKFIVIHDKFIKEEIVNFYLNINLSIFLSKREALGLTVLESMSCGIPVIARDNSSMSELIKSEVSGELLSNTPSLKEMCKLIEFVLKNLDKYDCYNYIVNNYSQEIVLKQYKFIMSSLLE